MSTSVTRARNAYLVLAHEDLAMLNILVARLLKTGSVWIHIDKSSPINIEQVIADNDVHVLKTIKVHWGGYSQVEATMLLASSAINSGANRLTLLSGVSYPIVTDTKLLEMANSDKDIFAAEIVDLKTIGKSFRRRFTCTHFTFHLRNGLSARIIRRGSREFCNFLPKLSPEEVLAPLKLTLGSAYWSVTRGTYLGSLNLLSENPKIEKYFKAIECSDESFFGTLFQAVSKNHVQSGTTFVKWGSNNRPEFLQEKDLMQAQERGFLFARKFKSANQGSVGFGLF